MITLHLPVGRREIQHAKTGEIRERLNERQYRPPFGTTWRTAGSGKPEPERVSATIEVFGVTLDAAATELNAVIADCTTTERIETPLGHWLINGLELAVPQPVALGYRLDVTWLAGGPRMPEGGYGVGTYGSGAYGGDNA